MQRPWVVSFGALLLLAAGLYVLLGGSEPESAAEDPWAEEQRRKEARQREEDAPVLEAGQGAQPGAAVGSTGEQAGAKAQAERPGPTEVRVISSETDLPLAAVSLRAGTELLGVTEDDGSFVIEAVPGEGLEIRAERAGYVALSAKARPREALEIVLPPGIPVSGRVVRAGSRGEPGAASMLVWDEDLRAEIASFTTDETGRFEIPAVRPNRPFFVTVSLDGLVPVVKRIVLDTPTDDLEILVGEGGFLTGRVHTLDDVPLTNVEVRLLRTGEPTLEHRVRPEGESRAEAGRIAARVASTRTDAEGRYIFRGVALDPAVQPVALVGPRRVARGKSADFEEPGQTIERDVPVPAAASLRIRVEDSAGKAIGDADLALRWSGGAWSVRPGDERVEGDLVLADLTPGAARITAARPGSATQSETVMLRPGEQSKVTLTFPRGAALKGTVKDKRGKPIWKARVTWTAGSEVVEVLTEMDGRFQFQRLAKAKGKVRVTARDLPSSNVAFEARTIEGAEAGGPPLDITLKDGTRVTGSFGELPEGNRVVSEMFPGTTYDTALLALDDRLRFTRRGPTPKQGALFVFRTRGFPPLLRSERRPFTSEEKRDLGPLFFEAVNPRRGRVVGDGGRPIWAAKVSVLTAWSSATARTDRQGDFVIPRLPRVPVRVRVEAEGYPANTVALSPQSEFRPQTIRLVRTVEARFAVLRADGKPAGKTTLLLRPLFDPPGGGKRSAQTETTNRRGRITLDLAPGRYVVEANAGRSGQGTRTIELTARRRQDVAVRVQ